MSITTCSHVSYFFFYLYCFLLSEIGATSGDIYRYKHEFYFFKIYRTQIATNTNYDFFKIYRTWNKSFSLSVNVVYKLVFVRNILKNDKGDRKLLIVAWMETGLELTKNVYFFQHCIAMCVDFIYIYTKTDVENINTIPKQCTYMHVNIKYNKSHEHIQSSIIFNIFFANCYHIYPMIKKCI